ncbi:MAG: XdhC family protein [Phycisphaerae bacterium]|nr:XdhC family protein [Gemmatimonadaceae bacterium]
MIPAPAIVGDATSLPAILQAIDRVRHLRPDVPLALATLVNVEGSSYRQPGARLLVDAEQRVLAGAISGGCLEGDVAARAVDVCLSGVATLLRYDLREDLETIWGFGAGCDGIAHVLLEPLTDDGWLRRAHESMMRRSQPLLVTTFASTNPAAIVGAHELMDLTGLDTALQHLDIPMQSGQPVVGAVARAGFEDSVLSEPLRAPVALHLIGAGRSAEAFATIAVAMGWQVTVIDHRSALLAEMRLPEAAGRLVRRAEQGIDDLPRDGRTAVALLTHIFDIDAAWLRALLPQSVAYVGVLGSRNRAARLMENLRDSVDEITDEMQGRLFAPIGLDLGGESPESIALAAVAEMEAVFHQRPGGFLKTRQSPIHTRTPVPIIVQGGADATVESCAIPRDERGVAL